MLGFIIRKCLYAERTLCLQAGDIGYSHFLIPFLKPREPSLDWVFAWLNEILDVACYIVTLITRQIIDLLLLPLLPIKHGITRISSLLHAMKPTFHRVTSSNATEEAEAEPDTTIRAVPSTSDSAKTPRRSKRSSKPRYSEIATPYVPGHLVADESVYPPVQPRLHPAERSTDDVSAFQEAMDRAQAAFYEVSSSVDGFDGRPEDSSMHGRRKSRRTKGREDDPFLPSTDNSAVEPVKQKTRVRKTVHLPTFQEEANDEQPASPQVIDTIQPSAKSLGKRREVSEEAYEASAEPETQDRSPEKIKKVGSFEASRHYSKQNGADTASLRKGTKSRPARPKTQAGSRLPTRLATRTEVGGSAIRPAVTESEHLAREAAIRARREKRNKG